MGKGNFGYEVTLNDYFPPTKRSRVFKRRIAKSANSFQSAIGLVNPDELPDVKPKNMMDEETASQSFPRTSGTDEMPTMQKKDVNKLWMYGGVALAGLVVLFFIFKPKKG